VLQRDPGHELQRRGRHRLHQIHAESLERPVTPSRSKMRAFSTLNPDSCRTARSPPSRGRGLRDVPQGDARRTRDGVGLTAWHHVTRCSYGESREAEDSPVNIVAPQLRMNGVSYCRG
jgi:hypothetical protein